MKKKKSWWHSRQKFVISSYKNKSLLNKKEKFCCDRWKKKIWEKNQASKINDCSKEFPYIPVLIFYIIFFFCFIIRSSSSFVVVVFVCIEWGRYIRIKFDFLWFSSWLSECTSIEHTNEEKKRREVKKKKFHNIPKKKKYRKDLLYILYKNVSLFTVCTQHKTLKRNRRSRHIRETGFRVKK